MQEQKHEVFARGDVSVARFRMEAGLAQSSSEPGSVIYLDFTSNVPKGVEDMMWYRSYRHVGVKGQITALEVQLSRQMCWSCILT